MKYFDNNISYTSGKTITYPAETTYLLPTTNKMKKQWRLKAQDVLARLSHHKYKRYIIKMKRLPLVRCGLNHRS